MKSRSNYVPKTEAARRIGVRRQLVYDLIRDGRLPVDAAGRIPRPAFEAWLDAIQPADNQYTDQLPEGPENDGAPG